METLPIVGKIYSGQDIYMRAANEKHPTVYFVIDVKNTKNGVEYTETEIEEKDITWHKKSGN